MPIPVTRDLLLYGYIASEFASLAAAFGVLAPPELPPEAVEFWRDKMQVGAETWSGIWCAAAGHEQTMLHADRLLLVRQYLTDNITELNRLKLEALL